MKRLLIQACSGRKAATTKPLPAFELYDGAAFRVIKKFLRENPSRQNSLKILILSAEYGLICAADKIAAYERRMDVNRASELQKQISRCWETEVAGASFESVFVNVGRDYLPALRLIDFPAASIFASGGIGIRNRQLKLWLNG